MPLLPTFHNAETKPKEGLAKRSFDQVGSSPANDIVINVSDYGATGGGADATLAFEKAWKAACSATGPATLVVSNKTTYLLKAIVFSGPCKSKVYLQIEGTIEASSNAADWSSENRMMWMLFSHVDNLIVGGGGTINGNGQVWWPKSCKIDKSQPCTVAPTALTFRSCNYLTVKNLNLKNSPQIHIKFDTCRNVTAASINIEAPETSPNTDGIQVAETKYIQINHCNIGTGDDCIAIVNGSQSVRVTSTVCGPGHGISIGSLGANNSEAYVSDVTVDNAQLRGTTNGVRIKTWQGGKGNAENIIFQNINIDDVQNPIIIDQNYCDETTPCKQQGSAVQISHVHYKNIKGTSGSTYATNFNCSNSFPCNDIVLEDINITAADDVPAVKSFCNNVRWSKIGTVLPTPCKLNHIHEFGLPYFGHQDPVDDY
ncbi:polygalacturonase-like [Phalaenopsis equestris]|uniref:polygalacturonase-like n=1 Tax=Phalaenopsis equestris TaxID=78828 RepID=UPI0009E63BD7|nr:polygalacturonase-like [Phalaenopsis equestris]